MSTDSFDYYQYLIFRAALFIIFVGSLIKFLTSQFPVLSRTTELLRNGVRFLLRFATYAKQIALKLAAWVRQLKP